MSRESGSEGDGLFEGDCVYFFRSPGMTATGAPSGASATSRHVTSL